MGLSKNVGMGVVFHNLLDYGLKGTDRRGRAGRRSAYLEGYV